jgi:hypothetical protein
MLREHKPSIDLGADYCDRLDTARLQRRNIQRLQHLGSSVTLIPVSAA